MQKKYPKYNFEKIQINLILNYIIKKNLIIDNKINLFMLNKCLKYIISYINNKLYFYLY